MLRLLIALLFVAAASRGSTVKDVCKTDGSHTCVFPFTYKGITHEVCTFHDTANNKAWCAYDIEAGSEVPTDGKHWDACDPSCPSEELWEEETQDVYCVDRYASGDVQNIMECQEKCEEENDCVGISYTYRGGYGHICIVCWTDQLTAAGYDFGFYRKPEAQHDCFDHDSKIIGGKGAGRVNDVLSAFDCQMQCVMNEECNAFIWNDADHKRNPNVCWLKKGFTEKGMKYAKHRHSGPKFC